MASKINYTEKDKLIVSILKNSETDLTLAEISELAGIPIAPGTMTSLVNKKGLAAKAGEKTVERLTKRTVAEYVLASADAKLNEKGKPVNYTDNEKKIIDVLGKAEAPMTLAEIAVALGVEKLTSGSINGLVKKGNVAKAGDRTVEVMGKAKVSTYEFVADVPEVEAEAPAAEQ